jgi:secondary thiamine-phosphate synthase enzyme
VITIHTEKLIQNTSGFCDIIDVTAKVADLLAKARLDHGQVTLFVSGSTAALTTIENESGLIQDLKEFIERLIPSDRRYHHDDRWGDDNGFSHVRASLFGPSLTIPVENGRLGLGTWQQIVLLDFDNRPRSRRITAQFIGESE